MRGIIREGAMPVPRSFDILRAVIEATPDAIFVKDLEGRYVVVNAAAARFIGREPEAIIGRNDFELYPEATAREFVQSDSQVLDGGHAREFEGVAVSEAGSRAYYLVTKGPVRGPGGETVGVYGISRDITELRQAHESLEQTREALFRSQKMEAVGQLTGGIAHDFNNILSVIIGNLDLLRLRLQRSGAAHDAAAQELNDAVLRAALHGKDLITQLLAFSGRRQLHAQRVDVNAHVIETVRLIGRTIGAGVEIATESDGRAGVALVDPSALEAAVLNIALNARDVMPDGGRLTIRTSRTDVRTPAVSPDDPQPGAYALLALEDTGCGMTPEVVTRAFEPFFTTKGKQGGTGLGLSMVYGFARQSGGTVAIRSVPGRGTTIEMFLPLAPEPAPRAADPISA
jgi:PAS domain S-box-containing protein